jgi:hypothetical protein
MACNKVTRERGASQCGRGGGGGIAWFELCKGISKQPRYIHRTTVVRKICVYVYSITSYLIKIMLHEVYMLSLEITHFICI